MSPGPALGTVSAGGYTFDITKITLAKGEIVIHWNVPNGHPPFKGAVTVTGPDGRRVAAGSVIELEKTVSVGDGYCLGCGYGLKVTVTPKAGVIPLREGTYPA